MKTFTVIAFLIACSATMIGQQTAPDPASLTPNDIFALKIKNVRSGDFAFDDIINLYLADRQGLTARQSTTSAFVNAVNATRTDIQIGAPSNAPGATTLTEKPGAADLLQMAIESGAVSQTKNGTSLTLATTPYLLAGFFGVRDTPQAWKDYASLRHFALSATFSNDTAVSTGDFSSIQTGEIKWTILGNRSPRDAVLSTLFVPEAEALIGGPQNAKQIACAEPTGLPNILQVQTDFSTWLHANQATVDEASVRAKLDQLIGNAVIDPAHQQLLSTCADATSVAEKGAFAAVVRLKAMSKAYVAQNDAHQLSVAASSHRDATVDDFATFKVLYGRNTAPKLSVNFNGEANFNQHHNAKNLHQIRSFAFEGGATMGRFNEGRFDATFSGKLWRNSDSKNKNVGVIQVKGNVYLANSLALPVSLSYANEQVETIKKGFQINIGIASLLDSFLSKPMAATP
jgi:hypothetical protein